MGSIGKLKLDRPLAVFDIESTGLNTRSDRILELSVIRIEPSGAEHTCTWMFNPEMAIPPESTAIHGITDEDVADAPVFAEEIDDIDTFLADCDLAGYNLLHFDIPILEEEFARCGRNLDTGARRVLDAQRIFHMKEPRDLSAALRFFCGREHTDAHGAESDARATLDVIRGEFAKYDDLPTDMDVIDREFGLRDPLDVDRAGKFRWDNGEVVLNFGKKKGAKLTDLAANDRNFLKWMVKSDFPVDTRRIAEDALEGVFPVCKLKQEPAGQ